MRRTLAITLMLTTAACHAASHTQADNGPERGIASEQLTRLARHWADAYARRDTAELNRLLADEFRDIDEHGISTKAQSLVEVARLAPAREPVIFADETFRVYGDIAVSIGRLGAQDEPPSKADYFTAVYVWRDKRWQPIVFQLTPRRSD
ncbi:MAG: hypothetical protein NVS4B3_13830 [Gemmatimonadaceae bacterium]